MFIHKYSLREKTSRKRNPPRTLILPYIDLIICQKLQIIFVDIGQGAFGEVFKVKEEGTENIFAVKISLSKLIDCNRSFIINLRREVSILSQLNHPSVIKFIGYSPIDFIQESYPVIISEYLPNGSLSDAIDLNRKSISPANWNDTKKLINIYGIASADIVHTISFTVT